MIKKLNIYLSEHLRSLSLSKRLRCIFLMTITPLTCICFLISAFYYRDTKNKINELTTQSLHFINTYISEELNSYIYKTYPIINQISDDCFFSEAANMSASEKKDYIKQFWNSNYKNVLFYDKDMSLIACLESAYNPTASWLSKAEACMQQGNKNQYWGSSKSLVGKNIIILIKKIYTFNDPHKLTGYICLVFDERHLFKNMYSSYSDSNSCIFLTDSDYNYISLLNDKQKLNTSIAAEIPDIYSNTYDTYGSFDGSFNKTKGMFYYEYNNSCDWYLFSFIKQSYLMHNLNFTIRIFIAIILLLTIISLTIIKFISKSFLDPIMDLTNFMNEVSHNNYQISIEDSHTDEIGLLSLNCSNMVKKLLWYTKKREEELAIQRKLELQSLQYQLQPHFLFNTLVSFKYIAMLNGNTSLEQGLTSLCSLLRQLLAKTDEKIPLSLELDNIRNYITLQEFRFAGSFEIKYEIADNTLDVLLPRMILQPIIENSIFHGMKEDELLSISIISEIQNSNLYITIIDDGKGFDKNQIKIKKNNLSGIGIDNIEERIKIIYHESGSFTLTSVPGKGTKAIICLPYER